MMGLPAGFGKSAFRHWREGTGSKRQAEPSCSLRVAMRRATHGTRLSFSRAFTDIVANEFGEEMMNARMVLLSALALLPVAISEPALAQDYPTKPITIVSAQAGGGASDTIGRMVSDRLQAALGQPVLIESRPGASGNVGAAAVARAAPDGYTLMIGTDAMMSSNVHLFKTMPFDPVKDFAPISNGANNIIVLAVHVDTPAKSVAELIAYAKANPGKLQFGSSGVASPHHLAGELLKLKTGIDIVHVPYRGGSLSANDLVGGHIGMASWLGFFAPAGTPRPVVARLNTELVKILNVDTVKERLGQLGLAVAAGTPEALAETVQNGIKVRGELIKAAKIEPQ
jgi:tripartite-type tricarboxylate transporter receptor subunit TctC